MNNIQTETGTSLALHCKAATVGVAMTMALGLSGSGSLADITAGSVEQSTATQSSTATKASDQSVTIHKEKTAAEPVKESKSFWKRLAHNSKVSWMPTDLMVPTDMIETSGDIKILAEVPGIEDKNLDVTVQGDKVTIKGEKTVDSDQKAEDFRRLERAYGKFEKTITLPSAVDSDKAVASLKDGVLTLTLPKLASAQNEGKKLAIRHE